MIWQRAAQHGWQCGEWRIGRFTIDGEAEFHLFEGDERRGRFVSLEAAQQRAERLTEKRSAVHHEGAHP